MKCPYCKRKLRTEAEKEHGLCASCEKDSANA
jgi:hypothetical protein